MNKFLHKLILGNDSANKPTSSAFHKRIHNIKAIWNNEQHDDVGIEKILRLFLAISQFLFPGTYIKQIFGRYGIAYQDVAVDVFVLIKIAFPLIVLYYDYSENNLAIGIMIWFVLETLLYVPTLIFASDIFSKPRSYRRSMLLLFFNFIEIILAFAVFYSHGKYMNKEFEGWVDSIYFSFVTSATIGYGDFYPITKVGKVLVSIQSVIFMIFMVLFLNFFSNKVESKGYFDDKNK